MASILEPSEVVVLPVYQLLHFALKSPMVTIKKGLVAETASRFSSKVAEVFKVIFGLIWRPVQRNKVLNFISKFYFKDYTFIKVMNID